MSRPLPLKPGDLPAPRTDTFWKAKLQDYLPLSFPSGSMTSNPPAEASIPGLYHRLSFGPLDPFFPPVSSGQAEDLLLAGFQVMLMRATGQEDVSMALRLGEKLLVLRTVVDGAYSGHRLLEQLRQAREEALVQPALSCLDFQAGKPGDENAMDALKVLFVLEHSEGTAAFDPATALEAFPRCPSPELICRVQKTGAGLMGELYCLGHLFSAEDPARLAGYYCRLLKGLSEEPHRQSGSLPMLSPAEEKEILETFNDTLFPYSRDKTLHELFEEQVLRTPDHTALIQGPSTMSYRELNEHANRLANRLLEKGVQAGDNIGLLVSRGFDMITGMFAILKAGGAYVPVDPEYPQDRQQYILHQSGVKLVLTDADYPVSKTASAPPFLFIHEASDSPPYSLLNPGLRIASTQLAYTIYTSGSTGRPKGVMIEHHSAVNLVEWVNHYFRVGGSDRLLFITSMCFDLSVYDIFGMLSCGGSLVIARSEEVRDVRLLQQLLLQHRITFWDSVPTTLDYLVRELELSGRNYIQPDLRLVFLSGDWIPTDLPGRIGRYFPQAVFVSLGGATEGTVWSNFHIVDRPDPQWTSIPYGKPLQNNFFYILNRQLQPVPAGVAGELFIGGVGVARGYAGDPEKTAGSFLEDPFSSRAGGRMYRTGDLGRMRAGMIMEFIGRKDNQVKIRGFRVELGEIENVLKQSPMVSQAVVLAPDDREGGRRLVGYIVPQGQLDRQALVGFLQQKLPDYMIPSAWMELERLPLTSNGKIDKKALPALEPSLPEAASDGAPVSDVEKSLAQFWMEALGLQKVGVLDNFFELGGHSLIAVQIMTRMETMTGKKYPIALLFKYPTIAQMAQYLEQEKKESAATIFKSLVPIKPGGNRMPVYIVHGVGLNVLNFHLLAEYMDPEQPVYGLQARGLDGEEAPLDNMEEIARHYVKEILESDPRGPYAITGYSFGGYVAVEMKKQLEALGKEVKMLGIFDTVALDMGARKRMIDRLAYKIKRQFPKLVWITRSFFKQPLKTWRYQFQLLRNVPWKMGLLREDPPQGLYARFSKINEKHQQAFNNYRLRPFEGRVHLFRANTNLYFMDDPRYLGWKEYAAKGVVVYRVPGNHKTMFEDPNARELARQLQEALHICCSESTPIAPNP